MSFQALLERHAAASFDKQVALAETLGVLGEHDWAIDLEAGTIAFSGKGAAGKGPSSNYVFPIQVLGFESEASESFRWAWAGGEGPLESVGEALLRAATTLRSLGESAAINELMLDELLLKRVDGHRLALVASGICGADAYYRCAMEGGGAFILLEAPILERKRNDDPERFVHVFTSLADAVPLNAPRALRHYAGWKRWQVSEVDGGMDVLTSAGQTIEVRFDEAGKVARAAVAAPDGASTHASSNQSQPGA